MQSAHEKPDALGFFLTRSALYSKRREIQKGGWAGWVNWPGTLVGDVPGSMTVKRSRTGLKKMSEYALIHLENTFRREKNEKRVMSDSKLSSNLESSVFTSAGTEITPLNDLGGVERTQVVGVSEWLLIPDQERSRTTRPPFAPKCSRGWKLSAKKLKK